MAINSGNRPLRVFLCHGSEDKPVIRELYSRLHNDGVQPWIDEKDILPGQDWDGAIRQALKNSDAILVCLSSRSARKEGYIQKEIRIAREVANEKPEGTIFIIPVSLDGCEIPQWLDKWQYVDYREEDSYEKILCSLTARADALFQTNESNKIILPQPLRLGRTRLAQSTSQKKTRTAKKVGIFESKREQIIQGLEERYIDRYSQKIDDRITLNLQLRYTEEGTTQQYALRYFAKDAKSIFRFQSELTEVLDKHRYLLIVGQPGAGKTTILLDIAISLLSEARANKFMPVPVIFNLASWQDTNVDFSQWLEDMLVQGNTFSRRLARKAIEEKQILPLLDGFDEVGYSIKAESERESPTHKVIEEKQILPLLGGFEGIEYSTKNQSEHELTRLPLLMPMDDFMARYEPNNLAIPLPEEFEGVVHPSKAKSEQQSLRSACLMSINDFMAKYEPYKLIICSRIDEYRSTMADAPVKAEIMVEPVEIAQVEHTLHLLSENPQREKLHPFINPTAAENMSHWMRINPAFARLIQTPFYFNLASQILDARNIDDALPQEEAMLSEYLVEKFVETKLTRLPDTNFSSPEKNKFWLSWLAKILNKRNEVVFELSTLQPSMLSRPKRHRFIFNFVVTLIVGLYHFYLPSIAEFYNKSDVDIPAWLGGWRAVVICGLIFGLLGRFSRFSKYYEIKTEDIRQWKLSKAVSFRSWINTLRFSLRYLGRSLIYGAIVGLTTVLFVSQTTQNRPLLVMMCVVASILGSFGGLWYGLVTGFLNELSIIKDFALTQSPFKKLRSGLLFHPLRWSVILFLAAFSLFVLLTKLYVILKADIGMSQFIITLVVLDWVQLGLVIGFLSTPFFKHFVLRYSLHEEGSIPLRYVAFLNYATKLRILERDGGQWRFRHQILQNHFAGLNIKHPEHSHSGIPIYKVAGYRR